MCEISNEVVSEAIMEATINNTPEPTIQRKQRFTGKVVKATLAGAVVDIGLDKPGVVHISQLRSEPVKRVEDAIQIGQEVDVWVRRVKPEANYYDLTMIEPLALEWREIKKGDTVTGKVVKLETFGAFIEIGAERPGLAHISELSHDYIRRPEDAVKIGDEVQAMVLEVNRRKRQIKLSLKALYAEPKAIMEEQEAEERVPAKTAFEIAYRRALEEGEDDIPAAGEAEATPVRKKTAAEREEILSRSLQNRPR
ncbi:MAG: S1 RNA-binding domain-containing protein [Chloroflexi bacterium]|nr:S1 RNA-binding domain-containing protein [Chloroflexota bacterium]